jgi:hypothetical protein
MSEGEPRLDRVEDEISTIRSEMGGLKTEMGLVKADVRGLSAILSRIEQGVVRAQDQQDERDTRSRTPPIALATVLVTIMSLLVGGAWMIGSTTAATNARLLDQQVAFEQVNHLRDREMDSITHRLDNFDHARPSQP